MIGLPITLARPPGFSARKMLDSIAELGGYWDLLHAHLSAVEELLYYCRRDQRDIVVSKDQEGLIVDVWIGPPNPEPVMYILQLPAEKNPWT